MKRYDTGSALAEHEGRAASAAGGGQLRRGARRLGGAGALLIGVTLAWLMATAGVVSAHARFVSSDPAPNQVLSKAPTSVTIEFIEHLDPSRSDIVVYDNLGKVVSPGQARVDRANTKKMTVSMQGDDSEIYAVYWHNASLDDGDPDAGTFTFGIGVPPASSDGGAASRGGGGGSGGTSPWLAALTGLAGLAAGAAGGVIFARRTVKA